MVRQASNQPLGSHLGGALAEHLADVIVSVRSRMAPIEQSHRIDVNNAWLEDAERRLQPLLEAMFEGVIPADDAPKWVKMVKDIVGAPKNQTDFIIYLMSAVGVVFALMGQLGGIAAQPYVNASWVKAPEKVLTPEVLADMVERNIVDKGSAATEAAMSGINAGRFDLMVLETGEPPPLDAMLRLFNRQGLGAGDFDRMVAYSRMRTEWTQALQDSYFTTMSGSDAIEAAVKGVIDTGTAESLFIQDGGIANQFQTLLDAAGDSIGVQQANSLYLHGLISHADLQAVILHSRINPRFEGMAELLRFHYLGIYQIEQALKSGGATAAQATEWMTDEGYPADQIAAFVSAATTAKVTTHKKISEAQAIKLYETDEITAPQFAALMVELGYTVDEVPAIIATYDASKMLAAQTRAVAAIRKSFIAGRTARGAASNDLDGVGVSSRARDAYLDDWQVEKETSFKTLTDTQIGQAAQSGYIAYADAVTRWIAMGYTDTDAVVLAQLYGYTPGAP